MATIDITKNLHDDMSTGIIITDKPFKILNQAALLSPAIAGSLEFKDDILYFTKTTALERIALSFATGSGASISYVDGSLAQRDTSINNINSRLIKADASLFTLLGRHNITEVSLGLLTTKVDASINYLRIYTDGSLGSRMVNGGYYSGNLDSITETGDYSITTGATNTPSGSNVNGSKLMHHNFDANAAKQVYYNYNDTRIWNRSKAGGTWGAWVEIALLTGATFTGGITAPTLNLIRTGTNIASMEIGNTDGSATTPFIDFHSGATACDYDSRILASGGNGTAGNGNLTITANVGIRTAPSYPLHVLGTAAISDSLIMRRSSSSLYLNVMGFSDTLGGAVTDNLSIGNAGGGLIIFHSNNAEKARLDSAGIFTAVAFSGRKNPRVQTFSSTTGSVTPNADADDVVDVTSLSGTSALTIANHSGTPVNKQSLMIDVYLVSGTGSIAYGTEYVDGGSTRPTAAVVGKTISILFIRHLSKWRCRSVSTEA